MSLSRQDDFQYQGRRRQMAEQINARLNLPEALFRALEQIPRHLFVETGLRHLAYLDAPLPIAAGQTISQPFTVAVQTRLLACKKWDKVLEIGTGCGYQTAVLSAMGYRVHSVERIRELYRSAGTLLGQLGYKAVLVHGDGFAGLPRFAPFNGILVSCAAPEVPAALLEQLAVGGRLVIPLGKDRVQRMKRITRAENGRFTYEDFGDYCFVPMLTGTL